MTTLIIEDNTSQAKTSIAYRRKLPFVNVKKESDFNLYDNLNRAFADVRMMMDGKKKETTVEEFLDELRNSNN